MKNNKFKNYNETLEAVKGDKYVNIDLNSINTEFLTRELCLEALKHSFHRIKKIPTELKTEDFYLEVLKNKGSSIELFEDYNITITDKLIKEAFKTYPAAILFMDTSKITEEIALDAIIRESTKKDIYSDVEEYSYLLYDFYKKLPNAILTAEIREMAVKFGLRIES